MQKTNIGGMPVFFNVFLIMLLFLFPVLLMIKIYVYPAVEESRINDKKEKLKLQAEEALEKIHSYAERVDYGIMPEHEALSGIKKYLHENEIKGKDNIFYYDFKNGVYLSARNELTGRNGIKVITSAEHKGISLNLLINDVKETGNGFYSISFAEPPSEKTINAVAYILQFKKWDWLAGAFITNEALNAEKTSAGKIIVLMVLFLISTGMAAAYIISKLVTKPFVKLADEVRHNGFQLYGDEQYGGYREIRKFIKSFYPVINTFNLIKKAASELRIGIWEWKTGEKFIIPDSIIRDLYCFAPENLVDYKELTAAVNEISRNDFEKSITRVMNGGKSELMEYKIIKPGCKERIVLAAHILINGAEKSRKKLIGLNLDITEEKWNKESLRQQIALQAQIIDASAAWINLLDPEGNVLLWNKAAEDISGFSKDEALGGNKILEWMFPDAEDLKRVKKKIEENIKQKIPVVNYESVITRKDGAKRSLLWKSSNLFDSIGNCTGSIAIGIDITETKNMEEQLKTALKNSEEANKLKSVILSNLSHELRTPMNGIMGFAGILKSEAKDKVLRGMASKIYDSGARLMDTFNSILNLAELEAGVIKNRDEFIDVEISVKSVLNIYEQKAINKNIKLNFKLNNEGITVRGEDSLFKRIISNLVDNAIKFSGGGEVKIAADSEFIDGELYSLTRISDEGIGIKPEYLEEIFTEFCQISRGIGRQFEGNGLGLTIARKTARLLGGDVIVESNFGCGSVFTVKMKGYQKERISELSAKTDTVKKERQVMSNSPSVLLVEDNVINQDIITIYLRGKYEMDIAGSGEEAIKMAEIKKYFVILMDIGLGAGIDGIETVKEIMKTATNADTSVIAVTGFTPDSIDPEFRDKICGDFLLKPFSKDELLNAIEKVKKKQSGL
jgi:PAS domain S-box-containing protein